MLLAIENALRNSTRYSEMLEMAAPIGQLSFSCFVGLSKVHRLWRKFAFPMDEKFHRGCADRAVVVADASQSCFFYLSLFLSSTAKFSWPHRKLHNTKCRMFTFQEYCFL